MEKRIQHRVRHNSQWHKCMDWFRRRVVESSRLAPPPFCVLTAQDWTHECTSWVRQQISVQYKTFWCEVVTSGFGVHRSHFNHIQRNTTIIWFRLFDQCISAIHTVLVTSFLFELIKRCIFYVCIIIRVER